MLIAAIVALPRVSPALESDFQSPPRHSVAGSVLQPENHLGDTGSRPAAESRHWLDSLRPVRSVPQSISTRSVSSDSSAGFDESEITGHHSTFADTTHSDRFGVPGMTTGPEQPRKPSYSNSIVRQSAFFDDEDADFSPFAPPREPSFHSEQFPNNRELHQPLTPQQVFSGGSPSGHSNAQWQILPDGLIYRTYIAGQKEPRMQFVSFYDTKTRRSIWESVLGGRAGLLRYSDPSCKNSDVFQLDLEGAVFARVLPEEVSAMLEGSDYRVGIYGTWKTGAVSWRAGYYHISAHVGDEYLIANPLFERINYVRDSLLTGVSLDLNEVSRVYAEMGYALGIEGGAKPFEFQVGTEYTPLPMTPAVGAPFAAVNGHFREDFGYSGSVNAVAGWGWQGPQSKRRFRVGLNYYYGPSLQYEFFDRRENLVGGGVWLDF